MINQESQIVPAYLLKLNSEKATKFLGKWSREVSSGGGEGGGGEGEVGFSLGHGDESYVPLVGVEAP